MWSIAPILAVAAPLLLAAGCDDWQMPPPGRVGGTATVIDGDTIEIAGLRLRFYDVTVYEITAPLGDVAARHLEAMIAGRPVHCRIVRPDRYGRFVARCRVADFDLAEKMVQDGWAKPYARAPKRFAPLLAEARAARRGMWRALPE